MRTELAKLLLIGLALTLSGCGTDTGNPQFTPSNNGATSESFGDRAARYSCAKVSSCRADLSQDDCLLTVLRLENLPPAFSLSSQQFKDLNAVSAAEQLGVLKPDEVAASACIADIESLNCSDRRVRQAYRPQNAQPFKKFVKIFGPDCRRVFTP